MLVVFSPIFVTDTKIKFRSSLIHDLLIAKPGASCFNTKSLKLIKSCLTNRLQIKKENISFRSWTKLLFGVRQGFVFDD